MNLDNQTTTVSATKWFMVTLVGKDQIGIVAKVTTALYEADCNLGEASMLRLGGNFTIMLMVNCTSQNLDNLLKPIADNLQLHLHIDAIDGQLHQHKVPNVRVSVHCADRAGIVAKVTTVLAEAGLNILELESDVGGNETKPFYIMQIEGFATLGLPVLETALQTLLSKQPDLEVKLETIETMVM